MSRFESAKLWKSLQLPAGVLVIAALATCVYWPSLPGPFIFDDTEYILHNPSVHASDGLNRLWFSTEQVDYYNPIPYSLFWLEWRVWGTNPTGYRVANLSLQIVTALLLWAVLQKLSIPGAFLGAVLFAVHPVNVECVAWIFQRRDLLATLFCLLSTACYLQADPRFSERSVPIQPTPGQERRFLPFGTWGWYALSLAAYLLGLLCKISIAPLPLMLLLVVWWKDRIRFWDLARIILFFVAGAALACFSIWVRTHNFPETRSDTLAERLDRAGAVVWFYLSKAIVPINLSLPYPQWHIDTSALLWWLPLLAAAILTALLFWQYQRTWCRALIFAWVFFCMAIAPASGMVEVGGFGHSIVWDHYGHLALIGPVALFAAGWGYWRQHSRMHGRLDALAAVLVCVLAVLGWQRSSLFANTIDLFEDTVAKNPQSWVGHLNLGNALLKSGRIEEAINHGQKAVDLQPQFAEGYVTLGVAQSAAGLNEQAIESFQAALQIRPNHPLARYNLGIALLNTGRTKEAIQCLQEAMQTDLTPSETHNNLGMLLAKKGLTQEAIEQLAQAVRLQPDNPGFHHNLGFALFGAGQRERAIEEFREAVRLQPDYVDAHDSLGFALLAVGRPEEAIEHFRQILRLNPANLVASANLAKCYAALNRPAEAIASAQQALEVARTTGQTAMAQQLNDWLIKYRAEHSNSALPAGTAPTGP